MKSGMLFFSQNQSLMCPSGSFPPFFTMIQGFRNCTSQNMEVCLSTYARNMCSNINPERLVHLSCLKQVDIDATICKV